MLSPSMKTYRPAAGLVVFLLLVFGAAVDAHRLLHQHTTGEFAASSATQQPNNSATAPATDDWPSDWPDVAIQLMSHGDITARGGALKALGRAKLQRIKAQSSVNLTIEALAAKLDKEKDLVSITRSYAYCEGFLETPVLSHGGV